MLQSVKVAGMEQEYYDIKWWIQNKLKLKNLFKDILYIFSCTDKFFKSFLWKIDTFRITSNESVTNCRHFSIIGQLQNKSYYFLVHLMFRSFLNLWRLLWFKSGICFDVSFYCSRIPTFLCLGIFKSIFASKIMWDHERLWLIL